ncbi:MAG: Mfa1 fimbrilin C-terminal domain-containing protein [Bacteroidales bacterium]|nr:Mfa1 fimbrilin C-terminal domain-containing protein [Candidatus Physcousia equi]
MKKVFYFAAVAATMLFTACSENNLAEQDVVVENSLGSVFNEQGNAFFNVNINIPDVASASKADGDEVLGEDDRNFNDGEKNEYNVENATLLLFGQKEDQTNERDYELISYYNLTPGDWEKNDQAQITQSRTAVVKVSKTNTEGYTALWALVLANKMNYVTIEGEENAPVLKYRTSEQATAAYTEVSPKGEKLTYGEIADLQITERHRNYKTSAFFMSNMPYTAATANGTESLEVKTLYWVNTQALYTSKEKAEDSDPAVVINIERSLAKVEVKTATDFDETTEVEKLKAKVEGWFVDNTNPKTSLMRNCAEPTDPFAYLNYQSAFNPKYAGYRFVSNGYVTPGCFRTFWAVDHNYNEDATDLISKKNTVATIDMMKFDVDGNVLSGSLREMGSYYYCTENTFDVAHQTEENTTRVIVAATFNDEKDFYTVSTQEGDIYKETGKEGEEGYVSAADNLKEYIKNEVVRRSINQAWAEYYLTDPSTLKNYIDVTFSYNNNAENPSTPTAGKLIAGISVNAEKLSGHTKTEHTPAEAVAKWPADNNTALNGSSYVYNYYKNGAAFYSIKIKHFGDAETPWTGKVGMHNTVASNYGVGTDEPTPSKNYLGRYGVVRNSWYNITVTGIRQIGSPTVPDAPVDVPDDVVEQYLKYTINVTPWRIYTQSEKLQ